MTMRREINVELELSPAPEGGSIKDTGEEDVLMGGAYMKPKYRDVYEK